MSSSLPKTSAALNDYMQKDRFSFICAIVLAALFSFPALALDTVTVLADPRLDVALARIARDYSREQGIVVNTSFASREDREAQITDGGAGDVLITHHAEWIDELKARGLIDIYSQTPLTRDRLALVGPWNSPLVQQGWEAFPLEPLIGQIDGEQSFLLPAPATPEGEYVDAALGKLGVAEALAPYTLRLKRLDQLFDIVVTQKAYGVFFQSSAAGRPGVRVIWTLPENVSPSLRYQAAVIAGDNMDKARQFLDYLKSPKARRVFRDSGFEE